MASARDVKCHSCPKLVEQYTNTFEGANLKAEKDWLLRQVLCCGCLLG